MKECKKCYVIGRHLANGLNSFQLNQHCCQNPSLAASFSFKTFIWRSLNVSLSLLWSCQLTWSITQLLKSQFGSSYPWHHPLTGCSTSCQAASFNLMDGKLFVEKIPNEIFEGFFDNAISHLLEQSSFLSVQNTSRDNDDRAGIALRSQRSQHLDCGSHGIRISHCWLFTVLMIPFLQIPSLKTLKLRPEFEFRFATTKKPVNRWALRIWSSLKKITLAATSSGITRLLARYV